ncbi:GNAT family N-acetyltransferase [Bdellovibrio sp. NC01]|uniref:GNAT family N-acetyltransferase n=1 Tax=Bdellovibrio sp. NC01 TaxID=2220073 RepID=UPI0011577098|nr:GNAT family protein [Bdellovibrio sp. NC01]QDK37172.1 GNAT family N-acetyltransferase [Bdellovibrio sp. NC01]
MENNQVFTDPWSAPVTLEGLATRLEPIGLQHLESLSRHVLFPQHFVDDYGGCVHPADVEKEIRHCLKSRELQLENGFAIIDKRTGEAVGYSNYLHLNRKNRNLDIGRTRIGIEFHKTHINTESKLLMLQHAFEQLGCLRVSFKVDCLNFNSQRAVKRLGAKFEGEMRNYMLLPDGRKRDYHCYSIIDTEWENVKKTLHGYLRKYDVQTLSL